MASWLKAGVALFMTGGIFDAFIGASTPIVTRIFGLSPIGALVLSSRADQQLLGVSPVQFVQGGPGEALYRILIDLVGLLLLAFGLFQTTVAWYGLRRGERWALGALVVADVAFISGWLLVLLTYVQRGITFSFLELPPNFYVPGILLVPAIVFSLIGLKQAKAPPQ